MAHYQALLQQYARAVRQTVRRAARRKEPWAGPSRDDIEIAGAENKCSARPIGILRLRLAWKFKLNMPLL